jgi:hypothetical protein
MNAPKNKRRQKQGNYGANNLPLIHKCATTPNVKVSDGSQPPLTFHLFLSDSAGSGSLHRLVGLRTV